MKKKDPLFDKTIEEQENNWEHTTVVRYTQLNPNDIERVEELISQFEVRLALTTLIANPSSDFITFYEQGIIASQGYLWHVTRYDDPYRDLDYWLKTDHGELELEALDVFRMLRGCLRAFLFLQDHDFYLTQFDEHNLYVCSFSEDRDNFFRIMFKGIHHPKSELQIKASTFSKEKKIRDNESKAKKLIDVGGLESLYLHYMQQAALMALWGIFYTNRETINKASQYCAPRDDYSSSEFQKVIEDAVKTCYKEGKEVGNLAEPFIVFLQDLFAGNTPLSELLTYKWITECTVLDVEEHKQEIEENERAKKAEQEAEENNKFGNI
jgi:hypothetical protein